MKVPKRAKARLAKENRTGGGVRRLVRVSARETPLRNPRRRS